jgi:hypothetical protein
LDHGRDWGGRKVREVSGRFNGRTIGEEGGVVEGLKIHWTVHGMDGMVVRKNCTGTVSLGT